MPDPFEVLPSNHSHIFSFLPFSQLPTCSKSSGSDDADKNKKSESSQEEEKDFSLKVLKEGILQKSANIADRGLEQH